MKINELINELEQVKEEHGNLKVISHVAQETNPHVEETLEKEKKLFMAYY